MPVMDRYPPILSSGVSPKNVLTLQTNANRIPIPINKPPIVIMTHSDSRRVFYPISAPTIAPKNIPKLMKRLRNLKTCLVAPEYLVAGVQEFQGVVVSVDVVQEFQDAVVSVDVATHVWETELKTHFV